MYISLSSRRWGRYASWGGGGKGGRGRSGAVGGGWGRSGRFEAGTWAQSQPTCQPTCQRHARGHTRTHARPHACTQRNAAGAHLEAVHREAAPRLLVAGLQVADGAVVHVLLLLAQKVGAHRVEGVGRQLVVALVMRGGEEGGRRQGGGWVGYDDACLHTRVAGVGQRWGV